MHCRNSKGTTNRNWRTTGCDTYQKIHYTRGWNHFPTNLLRSTLPATPADLRERIHHRNWSATLWLSQTLFNCSLHCRKYPSLSSHSPLMQTNRNIRLPRTVLMHCRSNNNMEITQANNKGSDTNLFFSFVPRNGRNLVFFMHGEFSELKATYYNVL